MDETKSKTKRRSRTRKVEAKNGWPLARIRLMIQKYRRALKREPEARQLEIEFPENLNQLALWQEENEAVADVRVAE